mmetsp:Transcript_25559/g.51146  ORF Transcript_25559/g.51146 Transcript_25559/m.51146 type:complete len:86 (-) Transcript_25559:17-274(-)
MTISNPLGSRDMRPNVNPENKAENMTKITISMYCTLMGIPLPPDSSSADAEFVGQGVVEVAESADCKILVFPRNWDDLDDDMLKK